MRKEELVLRRQVSSESSSLVTEDCRRRPRVPQAMILSVAITSIFDRIFTFAYLLRPFWICGRYSRIQPADHWDWWRLAYACKPYICCSFPIRTFDLMMIKSYESINQQSFASRHLPGGVCTIRFLSVAEGRGSIKGWRGPWSFNNRSCSVAIRFWCIVMQVHKAVTISAFIGWDKVKIK